MRYNLRLNFWFNGNKIITGSAGGMLLTDDKFAANKVRKWSTQSRMNMLLAMKVLSAENNKQLFIPKHFAHGFFVISETAEFTYKCDAFYHPEDEGGIIWNDPTIGVQWPIEGFDEIILADKDKKLLLWN